MVDLGSISNQDLEDLATVYNRLADRADVSEVWQAWGREVAAALSLELANRRMPEMWWGRLPEPGSPGLWESEAR